MIDTIIVLDMGKEIELFSAATAEPLPTDVTPTVFERVLTLAGESLGVEGREGRPVGTLFVIGDNDRVLRAEPSTGDQPLPRISGERAEHS